MNIQMPANPTLGQVYVPSNAVIYTWMGSYWSSATAIESGDGTICSRQPIRGLCV
jgi:hypothetical protein